MIPARNYYRVTSEPPSGNELFCALVVIRIQKTVQEKHPSRDIAQMTYVDVGSVHPCWSSNVT